MSKPKTNFKSILIDSKLHGKLKLHSVKIDKPINAISEELIAAYLDSLKTKSNSVQSLN